MNATPPVSQAQPSSDAVQPEAPTSAAAANTRAGSQDFAAALSDAGGKPARKIAANKQHDPAPSGSALPAPGNQPPPGLAPPPPAKAEASAAADAAAIVKGAQGGAPGSVPGAIAGASTAPGDPSGATGGLTLPNLDPAAPLTPTPAAPPVLATSPTPAISVDAPAPSPANGPTATGSGLRVPHAASLRAPPMAETSTAATGSAVPTGNTRTAKLSDTTATLRSTALADSAPSSTDSNAPNDSTLSNGPATAGADAASQAAIAAAIAQGPSAPEPDSADLPSGAAAGSGSSADAALAAGAPAAALAQASAAAISAAAISAAVTAATAASVAQAVFAAAGTSAADKRAHGTTPDSLSGASNDGSVGAAQLLTSNTSTDTVPTPTFKVAAGVDTAQFGQGVADRVSLMMDGNLTSAKLQVNPPALGPIEVRIALQGGHAQVWLSSHSAVTRDALESSSSKLREMLGSQGFSHVSVDISQRSFQERSPQSQAYESAPAISGDAPVLAQASASMSRSASGLLDAYA